jgi:hypothetical protein
MILKSAAGDYVYRFDALGYVPHVTKAIQLSLFDCKLFNHSALQANGQLRKHQDWRPIQIWKAVEMKANLTTKLRPLF